MLATTTCFNLGQPCEHIIRGTKVLLHYAKLLILITYVLFEINPFWIMFDELQQQRHKINVHYLRLNIAFLVLDYYYSRINI